MDGFGLQPQQSDPHTASVPNTDFLDEFLVQISNIPASSSDNHQPLPDDDSFFADFPFLRSDPPAQPEPLRSDTKHDELALPREVASEFLEPEVFVSPTTPKDDAAKVVDETIQSADDLDGDAVDNMVDETVFKRPFSPRSSPANQQSLSQTPECTSNVTVPSVPSAPFRMRRDFKYGSRLEANPVQKCFLTGVKRKRPETDTGHVASILASLQDEKKLMLPDALLVDYLAEAGVRVNDAKVARLVGAAAEHHTASIIQDVLQIFVDGQQERKKNPGRAKEIEGPRTDKVEKVPLKAKGVKTSRPNSGTSSEGSSRKGMGRGKKRKQPKVGDETASNAGQLLENGKEPSIPGNDNKEASVPEITPAESGETEEDLQEKATTKSTVSKEGEESTSKKLKKEKDKEAEKKNIMTLDLLAPVLREQGYQVGRPPYFVN